METQTDKVLESGTVLSFAPLWKRLLASVFDVLFIFFFVDKAVDWLLQKFTFGLEYFWLQWVGLVIFLIVFNYFFWQEYLWGRTLGQYLLCTKVVTITEKKLARHIATRVLFKLSIFDWFSVFNKNKTAWHDLWSFTRVVNCSAGHNSPAIEVSPKQLDKFTRYWQRSLLVFGGLFWALLILFPIVTFWRWEDPMILSADKLVWQEATWEGMEVAFPGKLSSIGSSDSDWEISWSKKFWHPKIRIAKWSDESPEVVLANFLQIAPALPSYINFNLLSYETYPDSLSPNLIWYQYELNVAPYNNSGFFWKIDNDWYQFNLEGVKSDGSEIMRNFFDKVYSQTSSL